MRDIPKLQLEILELIEKHTKSMTPQEKYCVTTVFIVAVGVLDHIITAKEKRDGDITTGRFHSR